MYGARSEGVERRLDGGLTLNQERRKRVRRVSQHTSVDSDASDLLTALLTSAIDDERRHFAPAALRSISEQRRHVLRNYLQRTWVDTLLQYAERLLAIGAIVVFTFWLIDGPLRDRLYAASRPAASHAPSPPVVRSLHPTEVPTPEAARKLARIPLPYVSANMAAATPSAASVVSGQGLVVTGQKATPQPTRLVVPAIELDTPVREVFVVDGVWEVAEYAAGYLNGTALPGEGNTALAGHAGIRGAVFRNLGQLSPGDDVYLETAGRRYHYRVRESKAVWPTQTEVLAPSPTPVLTLITCVNWDTQRLVVVADLIDALPLPEA